MNRRRFVAVLLWLPASFASVPGLAIRGQLEIGPGGTPELKLAGNKLIALEGDEQTISVLEDKRLAGADLEAIGHFNSPDRFEVDPIHTRALFVHKDGKRLYIAYWCDVCYIRTYTPGTCVCCQKYTDLDLRDSTQPE